MNEYATWLQPPRPLPDIEVRVLPKASPLTPEPPKARRLTLAGVLALPGQPGDPTRCTCTPIRAGERLAR